MYSDQFNFFRFHVVLNCLCPNDLYSRLLGMMTSRRLCTAQVPPARPLIFRSRTQSSGAGGSAPPSRYSSVCPPGGLASMCRLCLSPVGWSEAPAFKMT